ncbi:HNH endonuclease [Myxococcus virescens]|uniref:HNH endonuclease n=1 Tax=Myxococcus virescens TaxID=83456 RepID=A0A511HPE8_9BACT|nr:hypothetical protein [Myxococcus virescens]GEL75466.1 HNH endonuclease [Myxococcus virescens]SDF31764.1 hypothetical protein SAMN04488504_13033 [Myxococcus virescens]
MRKLKKPVDAAGDVFTLCVSGVVKDEVLKKRFEQVKPNIVKAAADYEAAAAAGTLHMVKEEADVAGVVTQKEMAKLYTAWMVGSTSKGRPIYDKIRNACSRCPLCRHREVETLDHHLPKKLFPALAVAPSNLIPACSDCNGIKLTQGPKTAEEQTFHPYFDDFGTERWLYAKVLEGAPPSLLFFVQPPAAWTALQAKRAEHHFTTFGLAELYAAQAGPELGSIRYSLTQQFLLGGVDGVRAHLTEQAVSKELFIPNSWQTAMYRALSESDWFCSEGFPRIPLADL